MIIFLLIFRIFADKNRHLFHSRASFASSLLQPKITNVFDDILDFQRQTEILPLLLCSFLLKSLYNKGLWERCEGGTAA